MKDLLILNPEKASETELSQFTVRDAARAVVVDGNNNVALLHVTSRSYYKLPGGGLDDGEDIETALQRECLEEIGTKVQIIKELGKVTEYRKMFTTLQISFCYLAKVVGDLRQPEFTSYELAAGFEVIWAPFTKTLDLVRQSKATDQEGELYIVPRDLAILKAAEEHLK